LLKGIRREHKLRVVFLTGLRPAASGDVDSLVDEIRAAEPTGQTSPLGAAVRAALNEPGGTSPSAVVLVSDGINTDGPPLADAAEYGFCRTSDGELATGDFPNCTRPFNIGSRTAGQQLNIYLRGDGQTDGLILNQATPPTAVPEPSPYALTRR